MKHPAPPIRTPPAPLSDRAAPSPGSAPAPAADGRGLAPQRIAELRTAFAADPQRVRMQNAVTRTAIDDVALRRDVVTTTDHTFRHHLDDWAVTSQKKSGRCWVFAGLNLLRAGAMRKMKLKDFQFSQNYTFFWDKLERANYFFEQILATADRDLGDRTVAYLLDHPLDDGGQWNMFVNVVKKHGLVPMAAMPEDRELVEHPADERQPQDDPPRRCRRRCVNWQSGRRGSRGARSPKRQDVLVKSGLPCAWRSTWARRRRASTGAGATTRRPFTPTAR